MALFSREEPELESMSEASGSCTRVFVPLVTATVVMKGVGVTPGALTWTVAVAWSASTTSSIEPD